ncbi:MAG TPA: hypothetical protein VKY27_10710 [Bacteriovoracaceae bacterium]|nr:hypothetical protein [Bacteriovoracaceae bacterium]
MKKMNLLIIFIFTTVACLPESYNFRENPLFILKEALTALEKRDSERFLRISGKEALCLYAHDAGIQRLSDNLPYTEDDLKVDHKLLSSQFNETPKFVGYWSYKSERHLFSIAEKSTKTKILDVLIDCEYGNEGEKLKAEERKDERKYKVKQCRLVKIVPLTFKGLALPTQCEALKVRLGPL